MIPEKNADCLTLERACEYLAEGWSIRKTTEELLQHLESEDLPALCKPVGGLAYFYVSAGCVRQVIDREGSIAVAASLEQLEDNDILVWFLDNPDQTRLERRIYIEKAALDTWASAMQESSEAGSMATAPEAEKWSVVQPKSFPGYRRPLYDFISAAHSAGEPIPKPADVIAHWVENPPKGYGIQVAPDRRSFDYYGKGPERSCDLEALSKAIKRLVTRH